MALIDLGIAEVQKAPKAADAALPIFERFKASAVGSLETSIAEWTGMGDKALGRTRGSGNWKVHTWLHGGPVASKIDEEGFQDAADPREPKTVAVCFKCGNKMMEVFTSQKDGTVAKQSIIAASEVSSALGKLLTIAQDLDKGSDLGKAFHKLAIENARPKNPKKNTYTYNEGTDKFEIDS